MKLTIEIPNASADAFIASLPLFGAVIVADKPKAQRKAKPVADLWEPVILRKNGEVVREIDGVTAQKLAKKIHNPFAVAPAVRKFDRQPWPLMANYYESKANGDNVTCSDDVVTRNDDGEWSSRQSTADYVAQFCELNSLTR